jgi:hypothetical protein
VLEHGCMFPKQLQTSKIAKVQASDTTDRPLHSSSNNRLAACLLSSLKVGVTSDVVSSSYQGTRSDLTNICMRSITKRYSHVFVRARMCSVVPRDSTSEHELRLLHSLYSSTLSAPRPHRSSPLLILHFSFLSSLSRPPRLPSSPL